MSKSIKIIVGVVLFLSINLVCKRLIDDFSMNHLIQPLPKDPLKEFAVSDYNSYLHQKYTYCGRGNQASVFISEDKEHVLKLFRPLFPSFRITIFGKKHKVRPIKLPFIKTLLEKVYAGEFALQKERDVQSFHNAFTFLKEETKLEYLHLYKTDHLKYELELYDKIGVRHLIDLDNTYFLIQKKTDLFYPTLASLIDKKEIEKSKELIHGFVDFYFQLINKGIDNPSSIERNLGCIGLSPVLIDIGRVFIAKDLDSNAKKKQLSESVRHMKKWISYHSPDLTPYLNECIDEKFKLLNSH